MRTSRILLTFAFALIVLLAVSVQAAAVGTAFTYQGRLIDANKAADGLYDFQFKLFDANSDGNQIGSDVNEPNIDVIDGYFTVGMDFGNVFDGNDRWLEIGVQPSGGGSFTTLSPRQQVMPTPYALYTQTAGSVAGGITGSGTANYIAQFIGPNTVGNSVIYESAGNIGVGTTSPAAMLDVNGDISAGSVYRIAGSTVLSTAGSNTFLGMYAGFSDQSGSDNTFSGFYAGYCNTTGNQNTFSGLEAGFENTTGSYNTFSGYQAGFANTTGYMNTFSGLEAGYCNTTGAYNTFSGFQAGYANTTGNRNTFSGYAAGYNNTTGNDNTFSGGWAGYANTTGYSNTFSGFGAGNYNTTGSYNTFSGDAAGFENTTGSGNVFIGYTAGYSETGSNKLYIANSSGTPLIYGDFSAGTLGFNTTSIPGGRAINTSTGAYLTTGGAWTNNSSRDVKENIRHIDGREVLEKLIKVPVSTWNYKVEDKSVRHIGPMAQDFYEAFKLGDSNKSIATIDGDGISLAAIQGLYQIVKEENAALKKENEEIKARLATMESLVAKLSLPQEGGVK